MNLNENVVVNGDVITDYLYIKGNINKTAFLNGETAVASTNHSYANPGEIIDPGVYAMYIDYYNSSNNTTICFYSLGIVPWFSGMQSRIGNCYVGIRCDSENRIRLFNSSGEDIVNSGSTRYKIYYNKIR